MSAHPPFPRPLGVIEEPIHLGPHPSEPKARLLETSLWLPRSVEEVFEFFSDARNLEAITPAWLKFRVLTPGMIDMLPGTLIDYELRLRVLPIRWQSEITAWDPPRRFVDEQRRGPYRKWAHEHVFSPESSGTRVIDRVTYAAPGGALVHRLLVDPDLRRIFKFRRRRLYELLAGSVETPNP